MSTLLFLSIMTLPLVVFVSLILALLIKCVRQIRRNPPQHDFNVPITDLTQLQRPRQPPTNQIVIRSSEGAPGGAKIAFMPDGALMFAQPSKSINVDLQIDREISAVVIYKTRSMSPAPTELSDPRKSMGIMNPQEQQ
eukprot:TRINITY_DN2979_c0_g2_i2.p1 TRINITY_DN2979_c0_g2~~TRINITY_DN2979_c0_g2_i2.p1  ORF type:complete len:138 (-),score=1.74 TRINITY_DN2979_c0_g2_i2:281-694(-)